MRDGTTEFPEPIGLAATFDPDLIHKMAVVIGTEGRVKHMLALKANGGTSNIFEGLKLELPQSEIQAGEPLPAEVTVTNSGNVAGDEIVHLYLQFPHLAGAPLKALRGFRRVHLEPGASQQVRFELTRRDFGMVTEAGDPIIAPGDYTITIGGGQPDSGAEVLTGHFHVNGQVALPQ